MVGNIPVALELGNAMVVIVVRVDVLTVNVRVAHEDSLVGVGAHGAIRHTVGNTQIGRTVREIVLVFVLVDVRSFHRLRAANLQGSLRAHIEALHILVKLVDIEDVVIVVGCRAAIAATATESEVARTVIIEEDGRVEAPTDTVAVRNTATPVVDQLLAARNGVGPRASNAVGTDKADTATTAIGEHDVESAIIGVHRNTGSPDIADTFHLAGIVNDTEVGPVLHVLGTESVKGLDVVAIGIVHGRIVRVGDNVEIGIIGSGTRVGQVMICGNRIVCQAKRGKTRHQAGCFPKACELFIIHKDSFDGDQHAMFLHLKTTFKKRLFPPQSTILYG